MKCLFSVLVFLQTVSISAQLDIPSRVVMNGADAEDRQVTGLGDPISEDAGMSLNAARSGITWTANASGSTILQAALDPPLAAYASGLLITLIPDAPNSPDAQLDLNGLGARPLVKWGGVPLDSADLIPGSPFRFVFDGAQFHLLGEVTLPCPEGFSPVTKRLCVMDSPIGPSSLYNAITTCGAMNARLCTFSEWAHACRSQPAFLATVIQLEWVDDAANSTSNAKNVGVSSVTQEFGCEYGANGNPLDGYRYRCCRNR